MAAQDRTGGEDGRPTWFVKITIPVRNRGEQILRDPSAYFEDARRRASEKVARDMRRRHRLNGA